MVVRKPEHSTGTFHNTPYQIDENIYLGVDRLAWEDIGEDYYAGRLSPSLARIKESLRLQNNDFVGLDVLRSYEDAVSVWRAFKEKNDIVAVRSSEVSEIKGSFDYDGEMNFLGYDCFCLGEWSVLLRGVYARPEHFSQEVKLLNEHGLLSTHVDCQAVFLRYLELSANQIVEPLRSGPTATHVEVFAVPPPNA